MPAYNFKEQFADMVEQGRKRQTIRPRRKRPTKVGDMLYLYTGMRTKKCRKLGEATCLRVRPIEIDPTNSKIILGGVELLPTGKDTLAHRDGFWTRGELFSFFRDQYPDLADREMELIEW